MERVSNRGWFPPPEWMDVHSCPGIAAYRMTGMVIERITVMCLRHDEQGNHLVHDPNTGGERWMPA
jgi:hypothetical protein